MLHRTLQRERAVTHAMQTESGVRRDCTKTEKRVRGAAAGRQVTPHADLRKIQALPYQILHDVTMT